MAVFSLLPNEIVCEILQVVLPEDLENFAQVSRNVAWLAKRFLPQHRSLIRRYSVLSNSRLGSIGSLLKEVLINPCINMYILRAFPPCFASQSEG